MEIDFTDQIKQARADKEAGYPPNCNEGYEEKDGKCVEIEGYWKKKNMANYPGQNVKRNKSGVPTKKMKKRACKPGEYRDKSGKLKKTKGSDVDIETPQPEPKDLSEEKMESNPNFNKEIVVEETEVHVEPSSRPLSERNREEYYKNLYRKVKGLD